jgi:hypothetical protein
VRVGGIDDQRSRRFLGNIRHFLLAQVRRKLRRTDFGLFFGRQRRQHDRTSVGPLGGALLGRTLRLHSAGDADGLADGSRRPQPAKIFIPAIRIGLLRRSGRAVRIDHLRRSIGTTVARIVRRQNRTGRAVGIDDRRRSVGTAVARIVRRQDRTGRALGIDRPAVRPAITRIGRGKHRTGGR